MLTLIKNARVYAPENLGKKDVLIAGGKIIDMKDDIDIQYDQLKVVDGQKQLLLPGFIDSHVHLLGGGGEGGFQTRTPEMMLSEITSAGVTTVVGCLGTDGLTRSMPSLVAKAKGLTEEGITAFAYTGSYRLPLKTLTGDIQKDIMMVNEIIGTGEVALSDHRSSQPSLDLFLQTCAETRLGGLLSGKAGVINVHLGDGKDQMDYLWYLMRETDIPVKHLLPTHVNRNRSLFFEGIEYAKAGGYIDFTTSTVPQFIDEGEVPAAEAYKIAIEKGVPLDAVTFSSDAQGSLPQFDRQGKLIGLDVGRVYSLYESVLKLVQSGLDIEKAILPVTLNPAQRLKLEQKGRIRIGGDADILLVDEASFAIQSVYAKGQLMFDEGKACVKGHFEKGD